jgi:Uncharacterised nucleotidyltransferase
MKQVLDQDSARLLRSIANSCPEDVSAFAELTRKMASWEAIIDAARRHGVAPLLYRRLAANEQFVPPEALRLARSEFERNAFHCITNAEELLEILRAFERAGIRAMPFKGVVLGVSAYGDLTARNAGDLDLLVDYHDLLAGTQILKSRGFELKTTVQPDGSPEAEFYFEYHFERASDGLVVELRWRLELTQPRYRYDLGIDWVWPRRRTVLLAGAEVPNLDPVSSLLVLCMHGSKHVWSRLIWVCDVAKLLESEPGMDWDRAQQEAKRVGLWRCLALGALLARRIGGAEIPSATLRTFESSRTVRELADFLDANLFAAPPKMPPGWIPYNLRILGFQDLIGVVLSSGILRPNARDRAVVRLPKALEPLYYLIRPFRVLLDRSGR